MPNQVEVKLNARNVANIERLYGGWRDCQRKDYFIHAIVLPKGYIFANRLEQPMSYNFLQNNCRKKAIVPLSTLNAQKRHFIKNHGYYLSGEDRVIISGTMGELWTTTPERFMSSYKMPDGSKIKTLPTTWTQYKSIGETVPTMRGLQIPVYYIGKIVKSYGVLLVNDTHSQGHGKGDIIVSKILPNGNVDYNSVKPINNSVFAQTFNQNVGGWGKSQAIVSQDKLKPITIEYLNTLIQPFPN